MLSVAPKGPVTMGVDVSHYQAAIDWEDVARYGVSFAFMKATEHTKIDQEFKFNWEGTLSVGLMRGAYHFFHPSEDAKAQAKLFCDTVGVLSNKDLPCVMDWESTDSTPSSTDVKNGLIFLDYVQNRTGKTPIIYSSPYFLQALGCGPIFARYPLWIAHYGVQAPLVPQPWKSWQFWQKTDSGNITGIGPCDVDVFNGSLDDLKRFAKT